LGASDDALKAMNNTFKFKGGALGIAQIALATNQEGTVGEFLLFLFRSIAKPVVES
jgi:hypothetical protein